MPNNFADREGGSEGSQFTKFCDNYHEISATTRTSTNRVKSDECIDSNCFAVQKLNSPHTQLHRITIVLSNTHLKVPSYNAMGNYLIYTNCSAFSRSFVLLKQALSLSEALYTDRAFLHL